MAAGGVRTELGALAEGSEAFLDGGGGSKKGGCGEKAGNSEDGAESGFAQARKAGGEGLSLVRLFSVRRAVAAWGDLAPDRKRTLILPETRYRVLRAEGRISCSVVGGRPIF
ncbi:MAG TPA: hypothetical protein VN809_13585 [Telmatospirillum sp.]|nr:hypothetical protein [Telmatospirillum sp.]